MKDRLTSAMTAGVEVSSEIIGFSVAALPRIATIIGNESALNSSISTANRCILRMF